MQVATLSAKERAHAAGEAENGGGVKEPRPPLKLSAAMPSNAGTSRAESGTDARLPASEPTAEAMPTSSRAARPACPGVAPMSRQSANVGRQRSTVAAPTAESEKRASSATSEYTVTETAWNSKAESPAAPAAAPKAFDDVQANWFAHTPTRAEVAAITSTIGTQLARSSRNILSAYLPTADRPFPRAGEHLLGRAVAGHARHQPVADERHAVGRRRGVHVVRDHDHGRAGVCHLTQDAQDERGVPRVQGPRRLVGEEHRRAGEQGAHQGGALLLAAGQPSRARAIGRVAFSSTVR